MFRNPFADGSVVLIIILLFVVLRPKRLPELGRGLGHGIKEFKEGITGRSHQDAAETAQLPEAPAETVPTQAPAQPVPTEEPAQPVSERRG